MRVWISLHGLLVRGVILLGENGVDAVVVVVVVVVIVVIVVIVVVIVSGSGRAALEVRVSFAPESGQEEGVTGAKMVDAHTGALEAVDGFGNHVAHAAGLFGTGDAEEASLWQEMVSKI